MWEEYKISLEISTHINWLPYAHSYFWLRSCSFVVGWLGFHLVIKLGSHNPISYITRKIKYVENENEYRLRK